MSPAVRVVAGPPAARLLDRPERARRVSLTLAELLVAARGAGDVPLPLRLSTPTPRLAARLASAPHDNDWIGRAHADAAPAGGAEQALAARGLISDGRLTPELGLALRHLAGARGSVVIDVRRDDEAVRTWLAVEGRLVARLSSGDARHYELGWFDLGRWGDEVARIARVEDAPEATDLPAAVTMSMRDLRSSGKDGDDLLGGVLGGVHGRLRVCAADRASGRSPMVASWLLSHGRWFELRPGRRATVRVVARTAADLAALTARFAHAQAARPQPADQPTRGDDNENR